jgi:hypothetical protein
MKTNITILTAVALLVAFSLHAQVAINTDGAAPHSSTMLDIQSGSMGMSFPNLNIADMSTAAPVTSPKTGLIAYNTNGTTGPGLVMWTGSRWVTFELQGTCWSLTGNAGTSVLTNFLGTTDYNSLAFKTDDVERFRVRSDGVVTVNTASAFSFSTLFSMASGSNTAIDGYTSGSGDAIWAYNNGTGSGLYGRAVDALAFGVWANNDHSSGTGLIAAGNNQSGTYLTAGSGISGAGGDGIYGLGRDWDGTGIIGVGNDGDSIFTLVGGTGGAFTGSSGIYAKVDNSSTGTGVIGVGYHVSTASTTTTGSGGAFTGYQGVYGKGIASNGTGVIGVGSNATGYYTHANGSGGAFTGTYCGVYSYANRTSGDRYGGYFGTGGGLYAYVGGRYGGINRKIVGTGTVSTIVKNTQGEIVTLVCPEAPEALFQDYGIGQLINGKAHITIDPDLAININVSPEHPLKVFITLEGDCNGVYVTNKSANGFDVIELQGGTSDVPFSWQIVATRANEEYTLRDGTTEISDYSQRFSPAPGPLETEMQIQKGNSIKQKSLEQKTIEINNDNAELKESAEIENTEKTESK